MRLTFFVLLLTIISFTDIYAKRIKGQIVFSEDTTDVEFKIPTKKFGKKGPVFDTGTPKLD